MDNSITITAVSPMASSQEYNSDVSYAPSDEADRPTHMGASPDELNQMPDYSRPLPPLHTSNHHTVLIPIPAEGGNRQPHLNDRWDNNHVRMPCSPHSQYPVGDKNAVKKVEGRWNLIQKALGKTMLSSLDLEEAIMEYNSRHIGKWDFSGLHAFFTDVLDREEAHAFFSKLLPKMIDLALALPNICTKAIPLLRQHSNHTITMSQKQASSLLANAFFCTFPSRNTQRKPSDLPSINFNGLYDGGRNGGIAPNKAEKLKCIIHYFRQVTEREPSGNLSFSRKSLEEFPKWERETTKFRKLHITSSGTIEDDGVRMLQVDFANKIIGGGVLHRGCVQEEIRFVICPELLISRLFTEVLDKNECLVMTGCQRFSKYVGYADTFQWNGNYHDKTPRDSWGRLCTQLVAIDANPFRSTREQYSPQWLNREINKAFVGFDDQSTRYQLPAIATGNWGCGAFRGDPQLKSLLQLMAAAKAGRDTMYFTFSNSSLCKEIFDMHSFLVAQNIHIDAVWKLLLDYHSFITAERKITTTLFRFIYNSISAYNNDTDVEESQ